MQSIVENQRLLVAPPGLTREQVAFWDDLLRRMVQSKDWLEQIEKRQWVNRFVPSADMPKVLAAEEKVQRDILTDLGLAK